MSKIDKSKDGFITIKAGELNTINMNGRVYLDGSQITGKHIPRIIDENMMPVPSTKIVEDEISFERRKYAPPPESEVAHPGEDGKELHKLAMKNEYKFDSFVPNQKKHYFTIDSIPHGQALEVLRVRYPSLYKFHENDTTRLVELGKAFEKWIEDCQYILNSNYQQVENPFDFPAVCHMYTGDEFLTMRQADESGITVGGSHPYHWRYSNKLNGIMFLDHKFVVSPYDVEVKGINFRMGQSPVKILHVGGAPKVVDWGTILEGTKDIPLDQLFAGGIHQGNHFGTPASRGHQVTGKTLFAASTGMALNTSVSYGVSLRSFEEREPNQPTVRTNGRQKIIDNGKRQWPAAKTRKGHRKG